MRGVNRDFAGALRGPVIMITIGVLFLLDKVDILRFGQTWPVILIVLGALALAGSQKRLPQAPYPPEVPYVPYPQAPYAQAPGVPPEMRPGSPPPPPGVRR